MAIYGQFSVDMPTELLKKGVAWQDRAVYTEAALHCRKELTDGVIDRVLLSMWMIDMPVDDRATALDRLVTLRALRKHRLGWRFPPHVWSEWGVMKADVEAKRAAEAQRKADYRAKMSQRDKRGTDESVPTGQARVSQPCPSPVPDSKSKRQSQRKSHKTEPSGTSRSVPSACSTNRDDRPTDERMATIVDLASHRLVERFPTRTNGDNHLATLRENVERKYGDLIRDALTRLPNSDAETVAQLVWNEITS